MATEEIKRVSSSGDDYYKILGVGKSASEDEIKKAYRKLALRLHPDKCQESGAEEAFKKVGEAFGVLSDSDKRQQYDQFGVSAVRGGGGGGGPGGVSPEDIFEAFFSQAGGHPFMRAGGVGGGTGGPRVVFSSGGLGGGNMFHFSTMGGGPGFSTHPGMRQRRGQQARRQRQEEEDEEDEKEPEAPQWMKTLQVVAGGLGPLLPVAIMMVIMLGMALIGKVLTAMMRNIMIVLPVMYLTQGNTKMYLLGGIVVLAMLGVL